MKKVYICVALFFCAIFLFLSACEKRQPQEKPQDFDPQIDAPAMYPIGVVDPEKAGETAILGEKPAIEDAGSGTLPAETAPGDSADTTSNSSVLPVAEENLENNENKSKEILESSDPNS